MTAILKPTIEADYTFAADTPFALECGAALRPVTLRYTMYGELNRRRDNALLVCHALSGSAHVGEWWDGLFGPEMPFDLSRHCVICVNILGSCYGSTGPASINPHTGRRYAGDFPVVSIGDMVRSQALLLDHLGVDKLHAVVGGSIGGLQALSWAMLYPDRVDRCVAIGAVPLSALGLALSHLQRQAICNDPAFKNGFYEAEAPPAAGLSVARGIAMCTYKSAQLFEERYGRAPNRNGEKPAEKLAHRYNVSGYLDYQGEIFIRRFDANAYLIISKAMDNFDFGSDHASQEDNLRRIKAKVLMVGISSDWLFPAADVFALTRRMQEAGVNAQYHELESDHGHDAFLANADLLVPLVKPFLHEDEMKKAACGLALTGER